MKGKVTNEWLKRQPTRSEVAKAKALARRVSGKLYQMMEASTVKTERRQNSE